jgi:RimJ/RimL family protein N-acetyltransferase
MPCTWPGASSSLLASAIIRCREFATEAARPVVSHAFATLKLAEVIAEIDPDNVGSLKVAEKLGLRGRGTVYHQGKPAFRYTLTIQEFDALS